MGATVLVLHHKSSKQESPSFKGLSYIKDADRLFLAGKNPARLLPARTRRDADDLRQPRRDCVAERTPVCRSPAPRVGSRNLREATAAVTAALDLDQVLDLIIANLRRVIPYDSCAVFLLEKGYVRLVRGSGFAHPEKLIGHRFPAGNPLVEEAFRTGRPVVLYDAQQDPRFQRWGEVEKIRGWIGLPMLAHGQPIGYLTIDSYTPGAYTEEHARLAQAFANQAAIALENARLFEQVQQAATTDALTGLANRRHFFDLAQREFARARRYGSTLSLFILDVDNLKEVNDSGGHLMGDRLLQMVGQKMRQQLRQPDIAARYGGDEFIVLLPETPLDKPSGWPNACAKAWLRK